METQLKNSTTESRNHPQKREVHSGLDQKCDTQTFDLKPSPRLIKEREDLSFTGWIYQNEFQVMNNWLPARLPRQIGQWEREYMTGRAMAEEVMALQAEDEAAAFEAIKFAVSSPGWRSDGSGTESGFADSIAALAVVGMRSLAKGSRFYTHD